MNKENGPVISFKGYRIKKISYKEYSKDDFKSKKKNIDTRVDVSCSVTDDFNRGKVELTVNFGNEKNKSIGSLVIDGYFNLMQDKTKTEKMQFLAVNGAAMLYPYARTITSMITSFDNPNVSVLPSLNFIEQFLKNKNNNN